MLKNYLTKSFLLLMMLYCLPGMAQNSDDAREVTSTYFLKNAFVVQKPGTIMSNTSVLIKDGMISAVGQNIEPPFDAMIIDADSMYIYAGFIDMASHTGIPKKETSSSNNRNNRPANPGKPSNEEAGITPEKKAIDDISMSDKSIAEMRKNGFTISHVVPEGRMLPGRGALISLGEGHKDHMVINDESSLFAQWKSSRGAFPSTIIAMISKWRDLYHNANHYNDYSKKYAMSPAGKPRPAADAATQSLVPVVEGKLPVFMVASKVLDIQKTLTLQKELGFSLVLTEVEQGYPVIDKIKQMNVPVLLSIDLPKEIKEEKKKEEKKSDEKNADDKPKAKEDKEKKKEDPETKALNERKKKAYADYLNQAGNMEKEGISFAFSFIEGKVKDFKTNIQRMMKHGLTENAALSAVTTTPAKMLGIQSNYGTVENGKMAHLVVTDKPYFDEKSNIRYVFVDGKKFEYEVKKPKKKAASNGEMVKVDGKWSYEIEIPGMTRGGNFKITQGEGEVSVQMSGEDSPDDYLDCTGTSLDGDNLTFDAAINENGMSFNLSFDLTVDGESIEGTVDVGQFGSFPVTGSKVSTPE